MRRTASRGSRGVCRTAVFPVACGLPGRAHLHGASMSFETFCPRQGSYDRSELGESRRRELLNCNHFDKVSTREATANLCDAVGGENVTRSGGIVADRLGGVLPEENRACVS